jgi:hypothetical protein
MMNDSVNSPAHYADSFGNIQCIEAIEASMGVEEFKGFLKGNVQKYVWRYSKKNGAEDLKKAQWYLERLIALRELEEALIGKAVKETMEAVSSVQYDPDDYMASGCPDGFCPLPGTRQGPSEPFFQPVS